MRVSIVGAGLFGSIIRDALKLDGHQVTVFDDERPGNGSAPAACLMKPSWFSGLGKGVFEPALEQLEELYGVSEHQFRVGPAKMNGVLWCDPTKILTGPDVFCTVQKVRDDHIVFTDRHEPNGLMTMPFDVCIVAAGVWSNELVDVPGLKGQAGVSFIYDGQVQEPFVRPWAPYKQLVAFNWKPYEIWCGDGRSIKAENWTDQHTAECRDRCNKALNAPEGPVREIWGIRPQIKGIKHAYVKRVSPKVWVATGGAKNGTLGAGWAASEIRRALQ